MNKQTSIAVAIVAIAAVVVAGYYYYRARPAARENAAGKAAQAALDELAATTSVSVPSANPLDAAKPASNPLGNTNPFNHGYRNPFE